MPMLKKKYPILNYRDKEYQKLYMNVYYFLNRDKLLARAARRVNCPECHKEMPYSSLTYHRNHKHGCSSKPSKKFFTVTKGNYRLTFD